MAERIEFVLTLNDKMTSRLATAKRVGQKTFDSLNRGNTRFNQNLTKTSKNVTGVTSGLKGMLGTALKIGAAFAGFNLIKTFTKTSIEMESARVAFDTFLGSVEKGGALMKELNQFANVTPFTNTQVIGAGKTLLAFGIQADQVKDSLGFLGDIAAGTGKPIKEIAQIFGQVKSIGKLTTERLNQLTERGFNPLEAISKRTGKSISVLRGEVGKGVISFDMLKQSFKDATGEGGKFQDMMLKQSKTLGGRISTMQGQFELFGVMFGDKLIAPVLGKLIEFAQGFLKSGEVVISALKNIGTAIKPVFVALGFFGSQTDAGAGFAEGLANVINMFLVPALTFLSSILSPIINMFMSVWTWMQENMKIIKILSGILLIGAAAWNAYRIATFLYQLWTKRAIIVTKLMAGAQAALNTVMSLNPIGLVIAAIVALVGAFLWAWNKIDAFRGFFIGVWEGIKTAWDGAGKFFKSIFKTIINVWFRPIFEVFGALKDLVVGLFSGDITSLGDVFKLAKSRVKNYMDDIKSDAGGMLQVGAKVGQKYKEGFDKGVAGKGKIDYSALGFGGNKTAAALAGTAAAGSTAASGGTAALNGNGIGTPTVAPPAAGELDKSTTMIGNKLEKPAIVNIDFNPDLEITINSANLPEATGEIRAEFERFLVDLANLSGRGYK